MMRPARAIGLACGLAVFAVALHSWAIASTGGALGTDIGVVAVAPGELQVGPGRALHAAGLQAGRAADGALRVRNITGVPVRVRLRALPSTRWSGSATAVRATVVDGGGGLLGLGGLLGSDDDVLTVEPSGGGTRLPLTVGLGSADYAWDVVLVLRVACNATFNSSTMAMSGSTITVTLGGAGGCPRNASSSATLTYVPAAGPTDRAGNALPTTARTETGAADRDF